MNEIGIMQGRVLPEQLDKLQVFPISNWNEELREISNIGFDCYEILYDKEFVCKDLLHDKNKIDDFFVTGSNSICMDCLSSLSVLEDAKAFNECLIDAILLLEKSSVDIFVIPFFDKNYIDTEKDFKQAISLMIENNVFDIACDKNKILGLEVILSADKIIDVIKKYYISNLKICYDLGNATAMGYSASDEIIKLKDYICHIHIKDRKVKGSNVMLGKGDVDFLSCMKSLQKIDYKGAFILETIYNKSPKKESLENLIFLKKCIGNL